MKKSTHKTNSLLKYSAIFLLGMSVLYFASAYTNINTSLTNATQYIQKIILTNDGTQSGTTGIILDGSNGNIISAGFISRGISIIASGTYSTAMGAWTRALGSYSTAMGESSQAKGTSSTAMGFATVASGDSATSMGRDTVALGANSTAMGNHTYAVGTNSTAMGSNTDANGINSTAMGFSTNASGEVSTAIGYGTTANGENSTALGTDTEANGDWSTVMGYRTTANGDYSTAIGKYNIGLLNSIFEIGVGDSLSVSKNAMTVLDNGKVGIGTTEPTALLTVEGGIKPIKATSNPCADTSGYAEGTMFYNDNSNYYCFCDATTTAKQMHSPATSCF